MKPLLLRHTHTTEFTPVKLHIEARVRYWEDAYINGQDDTEDGNAIPLKEGAFWKPTILLDSGRIENWPNGTTAEIHYKVCDAGQYWLEDAGGIRAKYKSFYVPGELLCPGENGYGDYIILTVGSDGSIANWQTTLDAEEWELVTA